MTNELKKVLLISYTGKKGGSGAYEMAKALSKEGVPVIALVSTSADNIENWRKLDIEEVFEIETYDGVIDYILKSILFGFKVKNRIKLINDKYSVQDVFCPMFSVWNPRINPLFPQAQKSLVIHDPKSHPGEVVKNLITKTDYKSYDIFFVHTRKFVSFVEDKYKKPTHYMPLGKYNQYRECKEKRQLIEYDNNKVNFLFFGRIIKYKGLDILAEAYRAIREKYNINATLTIVGSGDFRPYKKLYDGMKDVRVINNWISNNEVESVFTGKNIVCILPYNEASQSGVALVAMDYGAVVIAADSGGISEQIEDGKDGLLFEPRNVESLTMRMLEVAGDSQKREQISINASNKLKAATWDKSAKTLIDVLGIDY